MKNRIFCSLYMAIISAGLANAAQAVNCPTGIEFDFTESVQFGDGFSQSLPISGLSVPSSPGQIKDCIVVATGVNGGPATTNPAGMDDAYETPNATGTDYFRTGDAIDSPDPGGAAEFGGDTASTWDVELAALSTYLDGSNMLFYFNHNQTNSGASIDQDLFIWAQLILHDTTGAVADAVYDFTSISNDTPLLNFGRPFGDTNFDATATNYTSSGAAGNTFPSGAPGAAFPQLSDFVRARGEICEDAGGNIVPCDGSGGVVDTSTNTNLGADEVANAIFFPEIQGVLDTVGFDGFDVLQIDLRMGCNPAHVTCPAGSVLNNGFEQLFIVQSPQAGFCDQFPNDPICDPTLVPAPNSLALLALGLLGLMVGARRRVYNC